MRTTLRIDDDVAQDVKDLAHQEDVSFGCMMKRLLRAGLAVEKGRRRHRRRFRQPTFGLGKPRFDAEQALDLAAALEDEATARKLALRE